MEIVINTRYGGFGLSHKGVMLYAELKGIRLYAFVPKEDKDGNRNYFSYQCVPYKEGDKAFIIFYSTRPLVNGKIPEGAYFNNTDIQRNDPALIQTVKKLKKEASGGHAKLRIVEIPDDVGWEIEEYDGKEHVAEKHRTWS